MTGQQPRRATAAAVALSLGAATALAGVGAEVADAQVPPGWHVLVYTVNDSSSDLPLGVDLDEMVNASRSGVDFTVYVDSSEAAAPLYASAHVPATGEAIVVEISDGAATVTERLGELDSGSPDTLGWFVAETLAAHRDERTALVVWDHGLGWQGIAFDENVTAAGATSAPTYLDSAELASAVEAGLAAAGREQLDLLILDACLMANFEVVSEAHGIARHLISSEELVPGLGLDYDAFAAFADPAAEATTIFDRLAEGFVNDITTQAPSDADMITLSLIDLAQAPALDVAMTAFTTAAAADVTTNRQPYLQAANDGLRYGDTGDYWPGFLDLGEYLKRLGGVGGNVVEARDNLLTALDAAVVDQVGSASYGDATGLTVYFPLEPREYNARYDEQPTAQMWRPFLSSFYDAQAQVVLQTDIGFVSETLTVAPIEDGQFQIDAPVTANFSGTVELFAALPDASGGLNYFEDRLRHRDRRTGHRRALPGIDDDRRWHQHRRAVHPLCARGGRLARLLPIHPAARRRLDRQPQLGPRRGEHRPVHRHRPERHDRRVHARSRRPRLSDRDDPGRGWPASTPGHRPGFGSQSGVDGGR